MVYGDDIKVIVFRIFLMLMLLICVECVCVCVLEGRGEIEIEYIIRLYIIFGNYQ